MEALPLLELIHGRFMWFAYPASRETHNIARIKSLSLLFCWFFFFTRQIEISRHLRCEQKHNPVMTVVRNRRHVLPPTTTSATMADVLIIRVQSVVPETRRKLENQKSKRQHVAVRFTDQLGLLGSCYLPSQMWCWHL